MYSTLRQTPARGMAPTDRRTPRELGGTASPQHKLGAISCVAVTPLAAPPSSHRSPDLLKLSHVEESITSPIYLEQLLTLAQAVLCNSGPATHGTAGIKT